MWVMSNFLDKQSKHLYPLAIVAFYTEEQLSKIAAVICDLLFGEVLELGVINTSSPMLW